MKEVDKRREAILSLGKYIHDNPELAVEEYLAAEKITEILKNEGFTIQEKFEEMPTAVVAYKKNGSGPRIALVAEYDALPGIGHACGHNLIAAMSVGAALALSSMLDKYNGEVWLIGAPGEEKAVGKPFLIKKGVFNQVDLAMMIHPGNETVPAPIMLASESMEFVFHGKPAHAASSPHMGINALDAVIQLFNNVNALRQQLKDDARIHGIILEGGDAPNIIPHRTRARLIVRSKDNNYCKYLVEKVQKCAQAAAMATGTEVEISFFEQNCESLDSNEKLVELFKEQLNYFDVPIFEGDSSSASTDMGSVSQVIPALHPLLKVTKQQKVVEHHTPEYTKLTGSEEIEDATILGAKLLALIGNEILEKPELLIDIKNAKAKNL